MFQRIQELIDDTEALVCVLIDEVSLHTGHAHIPTQVAISVYYTPN